jgi:hypothetical protein
MPLRPISNESLLKYLAAACGSIWLRDDERNFMIGLKQPIQGWYCYIRSSSYSDTH